MLRICLCLSLLLSICTLPASFSWSSKDGRNYLNSPLNQNNPKRCESGWALATTAALSSRLNIATKARNEAFPMVQLSPQSLLQCDSYNSGCLGGEPNQALRWILRNNLTDSTCNPYKAQGYTNGLSCSAQSICQICLAQNGCKVQSTPKVYSFDQIAVVAGQADIATEIMNNGPVICGISSTAEFKSYSGGILKTASNASNHNHYVMVYGWGENGTDKYWLLQNSFGPTWGEQGSARILRGSNYLGVQASCLSAKFKAAATSPNTRIMQTDADGNEIPGSAQTDLRQPFPISKPLTPSQNQLNPNYCDASWAFAVVHALADSQLARSNGTKIRSFSVQALLNCGVGTCEKGGDPYEALTFISKYGIPEQGCQSYLAQTPEKQSCTAVQNCASCSGNSIFSSNCTDVKGYKRWKIYNFGSVSGVTAMSRQLFNHHALICGIDATTAFKAYTGGIFREITVAPKINHWVELVGEEKDYWVGRSSWGTAWGLNGFFKMKKGSENLGIEGKCYWAGNIA